MPPLTHDFKEFLHLLNSAKIEYLLIGGYAVGLYGYGRPTKDIDIWIAKSSENLQAVIEVLVKFGFPRLTVDDFRTDQNVFRMGISPNRIEVITKISGVDFVDCFSRRQAFQIEGIDVQVIDYEDLKRNKVASGRVHDVADVERLERARSRKA